MWQTRPYTRTNLATARRRRRVRRLCVALAAAVVVVGCSSSSDSTGGGELTVTDATIDWPANPDVAAVRLTIRNGTATDDVLLGASSGVAEASVHRSAIDAEGRSTMKEVERLDVPAGETVRFQPGGLHVMLRGPSPALEIGDKVAVILRFERAGARSVDAEVIEPDADTDTMSDMEAHDE